jgi:hypothetical protein
MAPISENSFPLVLLGGGVAAVSLLGYVFFAWFFLARKDSKVRQERREAESERKYVQERQVSAQAHLHDSLRMQREALEMTERFLRKQDEIIKLLMRIADAVESRSGSTSADQGSAPDRGGS